MEVIHHFSRNVPSQKITSANTSCPKLILCSIHEWPSSKVNIKPFPPVLEIHPAWILVPPITASSLASIASSVPTHCQSPDSPPRCYVTKSNTFCTLETAFSWYWNAGENIAATFFWLKVL